MHTTLPAGRPQRPEPVIDVQSIPPYQRHPMIFQAVQELAPGTGFSLVNNHDPRPLHLQLQSLLGPTFTWEYLERGPEVWRVRIGKPEAGEAAASHRVRIERNGRVVAADRFDELGPAGAGAQVCEVVDCPPGTAIEEVLDLMQGVLPPPGVVSLPYERLVARRSGSCCGGMCG
ncbi:DUF2249 domain-containing protein [Azospirillum thermophilum]|uniref:DUF2249 domain-containing protein n=1 Tax=Azospirillum thermophilum TaxID=2202148 RepID=A0A2S2CUD5_9PROT|nr:DUF2249 domain-containing protein [Azospirillum thermophilum]AWK88096.1 hypothetical protein DEW08_18375 [Azospirillum thermophilum]